MSGSPGWGVVAVVSEFFIWLGITVADWFVSLLPEWDVPPEILGFATTVNDFVAGFSGLGVWAPWPLVIACAGIAVTAWVIGLTVKGIRALAAHIPLVGGAG